MIIRTISQRVVAEYEQYKQNVFSQNGEDGLIQYFLKKMDIKTGYFVEFGAWDGVHLSNCANLAQVGWSGCFIEGDDERYLDLERNYGDNDKVMKVNCFILPHGERSLDNVLTKIGAPRHLEILSIDIDGYDYAVWDGLTDFDARLVVIEFNPTIPANVVNIQDEYDDTCFGNSLAALWELGLKKGYRLIATTDCNAFFALNEDCNKYQIPSYSPWEIKDNEFETFLFHGHNGQVKLAGNKTLVWHGVPMKEENFQVLPKTLQKIPVCQANEYFTELERFKKDM